MPIIQLVDITPLVAVILSIAIIWSMAWKGIALWIAARKSHLAWFIVLFIVSTIGILDILYIYVFSKSQDKVKKQGKRSARKTARRRGRR